MLPTSVRIMLCTQPQDMRRSFDTLERRSRFGDDAQLELAADLEHVQVQAAEVLALGRTPELPIPQPQR